MMRFLPAAAQHAGFARSLFYSRLHRLTDVVVVQVRVSCALWLPYPRLPGGYHSSDNSLPS